MVFNIVIISLRQGSTWYLKQIVIACDSTNPVFARQSPTFEETHIESMHPFGLVKQPRLTFFLNCSLSFVCCIISCLSVWVRASALLLASWRSPSLERPFPLANGWCPNTELKAFSIVAIAPWGPPTQNSQMFLCVIWRPPWPQLCHPTLPWNCNPNGRSYKCNK